jgi:hypothetical protein
MELIMARPFTDITKSISANNIKNGTLLVATGGLRTGSSSSYFNKVYDQYVQTYPVITDIQSKYGYRFYNGLFIDSVDNGTV